MQLLEQEDMKRIAVTFKNRQEVIQNGIYWMMCSPYWTENVDLLPWTEQSNGGEYMYRIIIIDEENDVVEINSQCNGIYLATTDEKGSLYSYVLGNAHRMTINKEEKK